MKFFQKIKELLPTNVDAFTSPISDSANNDATSILRVVDILFSFFSVIIAVFLVYNTPQSCVEESRKEVGMLRLIVMTNIQVKRYFLR